MVMTIGAKSNIGSEYLRIATRVFSQTPAIKGNLRIRRELFVTPGKRRYRQCEVPLYISDYATQSGVGHHDDNSRGYGCVTDFCDLENSSAMYFLVYAILPRSCASLVDKSN